jgi:hypothetical protein
MRRRPFLLEHLSFGCLDACTLRRVAGRGDGDRDGQAAAVTGAGGCGAAGDRRDGRDDGQAETEAVVGARSLSRWNRSKTRPAGN